MDTEKKIIKNIAMFLIIFFFRRSFGLLCRTTPKSYTVSYDLLKTPGADFKNNQTSKQLKTLF